MSTFENNHNIQNWFERKSNMETRIKANTYHQNFSQYCYWLCSRNEFSAVKVYVGLCVITIIINRVMVVINIVMAMLMIVMM